MRLRLFHAQLVTRVSTPQITPTDHNREFHACVMDCLGQEFGQALGRPWIDPIAGITNQIFAAEFEQDPAIWAPTGRNLVCRPADFLILDIDGHGLLLHSATRHCNAPALIMFRIRKG
jgi:hypothetical protein